MSTRQERRRREREENKKIKKEIRPRTEVDSRKMVEYNMDAKLLQPWSAPIMATKLPKPVLGKMIEISDEIVDDKKQHKSWGHNLAGQIETELLIPHKKLEEAGIMTFFMDTIRQFVIQCKSQMHPFQEESIRAETWLTQMLSMWIVSQFPNEYNPMHLHTQCHVSSVMYLKVPKFDESIKKHRPEDDGSILFTNSAGRDQEFCTPNFNIVPKVGDFFIFGAHQYHAVYPYRCSVGDPERRSVSFNAIFKSKTQHDIDMKNQKEQQEANMREVQGLPKDSRH